MHSHRFKFIDNKTSIRGSSLLHLVIRFDSTELTGPFFNSGQPQNRLPKLFSSRHRTNSSAISKKWFIKFCTGFKSKEKGDRSPVDTKETQKNPKNYGDTDPSLGLSVAGRRIGRSQVMSGLTSKKLWGIFLIES